MVLFCLSVTGEVFSQAPKDTLTVCLGKARPKSLDPAVSNTRQVLTLYHNWGDTLLYRDPVTGEIVPGLAESYKILDNGDMELVLRKGVRFHLHFGYENRVTRYPYDPARARQLLAEAGYPTGFDTDFYAINNESAAESILEDLKAVGIRAKPKWMMGKFP